MVENPSILGILLFVFVGWVRDMRQRIADLIVERDTARAGEATITKLYRELRDVYNVVIGQYRQLARRVPDADPLPYSPEAGDHDGETR